MIFSKLNIFFFLILIWHRSILYGPYTHHDFCDILLTCLTPWITYGTQGIRNSSPAHLILGSPFQFSPRQFKPQCFISSSQDRLQVIIGQPTHLFPCLADSTSSPAGWNLTGVLQRMSYPLPLSWHIGLQTMDMTYIQ